MNLEAPVGFYCQSEGKWKDSLAYSIGRSENRWGKLYRFTTAYSSLEFTTRRRGRRMCAHLLLWEIQSYNSLLNNHQQENVGSHQKKKPHIQRQRRSPSKTLRGAKSHLESNHITARDTQRLKQTLCALGPRDPTETEPELFKCLLWRNGSAVACCKGRDSGCSRPGYGISPLGGGRH